MNNEIMSLFNSLSQSNNPMSIMQQMDNPFMQQAIKMAQGNKADIGSVIKKIAKQKGIPDVVVDNLSQMTNIKL